MINTCIWRAEQQALELAAEYPGAGESLVVVTEALPLDHPERVQAGWPLWNGGWQPQCEYSHTITVWYTTEYAAMWGAMADGTIHLWCD